VKFVQELKVCKSHFFYYRIFRFAETLRRISVSCAIAKILAEHGIIHDCKQKAFWIIHSCINSVVSK